MIPGRITEDRAATRQARGLGAAAAVEEVADARRRRLRVPWRPGRVPPPGTTPPPVPSPRGSRPCSRPGCGSRTSPRRSMVRTRATCGQVSPPQAPAFMARAPPMVPGMPARNSIPTRPRRAAKRATLAQEAPAWARMPSSPTAARSCRQPWVSITVPGKPSSATSRLLPRPSQSSGSSGSRRRRNSARSAASAGRYRRRAGPPTRQLVWRARGSSRDSSPRRPWVFISGSRGGAGPGRRCHRPP